MIRLYLSPNVLYQFVQIILILNVSLITETSKYFALKQINPLRRAASTLAFITIKSNCHCRTYEYLNLTFDSENWTLGA